MRTLWRGFVILSGVAAQMYALGVICRWWASGIDDPYLAFIVGYGCCVLVRAADPYILSKKRREPSPAMARS